MALNVRIIAPGTDEVPLVTYFAYIRQKDQDLYLDFDDDTWKAFASLVTPSILYTEDPDQPGVWTFTYTLPAFTGLIDIISRDTPNSLLVPDFEVQTIGVDNGSPLLDLAVPQVMIHTDTGGLDELRVTDNNGEPIENAIIRLFTKLDFDSADFDSPLALTSTDANGRWLNPIPVNAGATYVILVNKPHVFGSVSVEVTV